MECPYCGHTHSKVVDSRQRTDYGVGRRRECLACGDRYSTTEIIVGWDTRNKWPARNTLDLDTQEMYDLIERLIEWRSNLAKD